MAVIVTSSFKGRTPIIILNTYDENDNLTDPDGVNGSPAIYPTIVITKSDSELVDPVVEEAMTRTSLGEFKYYWDTRSIQPGTYKIEISYFMDGNSQLQKMQYVLAE